MDAYYKKIVYKKNAFEDLKTYIKLNYSNKKILLVSTKSVPAEDVTVLLNALFCGSDSVAHFVARRGFDEKELELLKNKIICADVVVTVGGGKCCDVVKFFCSTFDLPYVVCPSVATSISYFTSYCINPYDSSKSYYAKMPNKIFIQEALIKGANCETNISGLCFLHALRTIFVEGVINNKEKEKFVYIGMGKLFEKLDQEQTNILLCNEDSNLVLMDLFIDFGFFLSMINIDDFFLTNMYCVYNKIGAVQNGAGKQMLLCTKAILSAMKRFLEYGSLRVVEVPNYCAISKLIKNNKIFVKKLKNNCYFNKFWQKIYLKRQFLSNKETNYRLISIHLKNISEFVKRVKSVYKRGLEINDISNNSLISLATVPYISGNSEFFDFMAGSGIFNNIISNCGV